MKKIFYILAPLILFTGILLPQHVSAKSVTWTGSAVGGGYYGSFFGTNQTDKTGTNVLFGASTINIKYYAKVLDETGQEIPDNANVSPGAKIKLRFVPHEFYDAVWFLSTNYFHPYGTWIKDALPPSAGVCSDYRNLVASRGTTGYFAGHATNVTLNADIYIPFSVNPPTKSITNTDGLQCGSFSTYPDGSSGMDCTVASSTTAIHPVFSFGNTYGIFYFGQITPNALVTQLSKTAAGQMTLGFIGMSANGAAKLADSACKYGGHSNPVQVPAQTIAFNLNVVNGNHPPTAPIISGEKGGVLAPVLKKIKDKTSNNLFNFIPSFLSKVEAARLSDITGNLQTTISYTAVSTDIDGDQIKYNYDWTNSGSQDYTDYSASGVPSSPKSRTYTTATSSTFRVQAVDSRGAVSPWVTYPVNITTSCAAPSAPATISPRGNISSGVTAITWSPVEGVDHYALRVDDQVNPWSGTATVNQGDVYDDNVTTTSYPYTFKAGHKYNIWVYAVASCGSLSDASAASQVTVAGAALTADLKLNGQDNISVTSGTPVTLSWTSENAVTCASKGDTFFDTKGATSGSVSVPSDKPTSFSISCLNETTDANDTARLDMTDVNNVSVDANATYCAVNPTDAACIATYGKVSVSLLSKIAPGATYKDAAAIAVSDKAVVYLKWLPNDAKGVSCSLTTNGGEVANDATNPTHEYITPALSESTLYTVTCSNPISTGKDVVNVGVIKVSEF